MKIALPLDEFDLGGSIASLKDVKAWALVDIGIDQKLYKKFEDIDDFIDFVVVDSKDEEVERFLDEGIDILIAPFQKSIDDIVEAFMFKELYELGN